MAERSAARAGRFEDAVAEFLGIMEGRTAAQWRTLCPNEARTVGVLARHVAAAIPFQMRVFGEIARRRQPHPISWAQLAEINAQDAVDWADAPRGETLALLREHAAAAAGEVRQMGMMELGRAGRYIADLDAPWTVEQWLERVLIGHVHGHLQSIRAALASEGVR